MRYLKTLLVAAFAWGLGMFGFMTGGLVEFAEIDYGGVGKILARLIPASVMFGLLTSSVLYAYDRKRLARGIDVRDDRLRPFESHLVAAPIDEARALVLRALEQLDRTRVKQSDDGILVATTGMTWRSFGEVVRAELKGVEDDRTILLLSSRSRFRCTIIDYGKNSDNLTVVRRALRKVIVGSEDT